MVRRSQPGHRGVGRVSRNQSVLKESKMNLKTKTVRNWRRIFRRPQRVHDPLLVFNMAMFNFAGDWNRIFNQARSHPNVT